MYVLQAETIRPRSAAPPRRSSRPPRKPERPSRLLSKANKRALADLRLRQPRPTVSPSTTGRPTSALWTIDAHDTLEFPPSVGYGRVYLAQQKGLFFALDAKTGKLRGSATGRCAASSPTVGKGSSTVLHAPRRVPPGSVGRRRFVVAWTPRPDERWRYRTAPVESSPLLARQRLYFGSWDHGVHAVNANTGRRIWRFQADDEMNTSAAWWSDRIFIADGRVALLAGREDRQAGSGSARPGRGEFFYATRRSPTGGSSSATPTARCTSTGRGAAGCFGRGRWGLHLRRGRGQPNACSLSGTYDGGSTRSMPAPATSGGSRTPRAVRGSPTIMNGLVYFSSSCSTCGSEAHAR